MANPKRALLQSTIVPLSSKQETLRVIGQGTCQPSLLLSLYSNKVSAGFPSPADNDIEKILDLNEHLIKTPAATFLVRVSGQSMVDAGIQDNDILIVDRSLEPGEGRIIVAAINGELTVKRLRKGADGQWLLLPANKDYPAITVAEESSVTIWGVVAHVIHSF